MLMDYSCYVCSMAGNQMAAPSHLSFRLQGQGLQSVQMMNINRNSKVNNGIVTLQSSSPFSDTLALIF